MCLLRWERYPGCKHTYKRFGSRCGAARKPGASRCPEPGCPPQVFDSEGPEYCPTCYRYVVNGIRQKQVDDVATICKSLKRNQAKCSSKDRCKASAALDALDRNFEDLARVNYFGKKELVDFWESMWGWVDIGVPGERSPSPVELDECTKLLTERYSDWFLPGEAVFGEYLTQRGRYERAARWASPWGGGGPNIRYVVGDWTRIDPEARSLPQIYASDLLNRRSLHMDLRQLRRING
ncbi:MAG: hypothetical protein M1812_004361 [Candelaria pacifica]|nr:MAG: hypothetical protein M1812_004361 [Candelaria pacifica]